MEDDENYDDDYINNNNIINVKDNDNNNNENGLSFNRLCFLQKLIKKESYLKELCKKNYFFLIFSH